ncbi:transcriptional regulator CtsR [Clostridia bacterium]|nr:transcriptional regulator CtsR [Clostridia bacterium]
MSIADMIARYIIETLESGNGELSVQRAHVASLFNCAPSQVNYVIETRFTPEHGYMVSSRKGGHGGLRIIRVPVSPGTALVMSTINALGDSADAALAAALIHNLTNVLPGEICGLLSAATDKIALKPVPPEYRDEARAAILKRCLIKLITEGLQDERI